MNKTSIINKFLSIVISVLVFISLFSLSGTVVADDQRNANWVEDINQLEQELPLKHPNLFTVMTKEYFTSELERLRSDVPNLEDSQIAAKLYKTVCTAQDPHTSIYYNKFNYYPLSFRWLKEGIYLITTTPDCKEALNKKLAAVNGKTVDELLDLLSPFIASENKFWFKERFIRTLYMPELMKEAGVIDDCSKAVFSFVDEDGNVVDISPKMRSFYDEIEWITDPEMQKKWDENPPLSSQVSGNYGLKIIPEKKTLYLKYKKCIEDKNYPMKTFFNDLKLKYNELKPEKVIVDIRGNTGGGTGLFLDIFYWIWLNEEINKAEKLFVLIDRRTFSAAVQICVLLYDKTNATFVGEPTGNKPNHFGEVRMFVLKNSKIEVYHSTKYMRITELETDALYPDTTIEWDANSYFNAIDPVADVVLNGKVPPNTRPKKITNKDTRNMTRDERWQYYLEGLSYSLSAYNKQLFKTVPKEEFESMINELIEKVPILSDLDIKLNLMEILAKMKDYQMIYCFYYDFKSFQIRFKYMHDGFYVFCADKPYANVLGRKLLRIEENGIDEIRHAMKRLVCSPNQYHLNFWMTQIMIFPEILKYLNITAKIDETTFVFEGDNGCEIELKLKASDINKTPNFIYTKLHDTPNDLKPLSYQAGPSITVQKDKNCLYLKTVLFGTYEAPIFDDFFKNYMNTLNQNPTLPIIVDFRTHFHTRDSLEDKIYLDLVEKLKKDKTLKVYVLVGLESRGKASEYAVMLRNAGATIIGEPTQYPPNHVSHENTLTFNNSFYIIIPTGVDLKLDLKNPNSLYPDYTIPLMPWDYFAMKDKVLEYAYYLIKKDADNGKETLVMPNQNPVGYAPITE